VKQPDETLLQERTVKHSTPSDDGLGFHLLLSCGHDIWTAVEPHANRIICGECLELLVNQCREAQAGQQPS
jgi:hypothetical protein